MPDPTPEPLSDAAWLRELADDYDSYSSSGPTKAAARFRSIAARLEPAEPVVRGVPVDLLKLAAQAVAEKPQRDAESVDEWAERLAADLAQADAAPPAGSAPPGGEPVADRESVEIIRQDNGRWMVAVELFTVARDLDREAARQIKIAIDTFGGSRSVDQWARLVIPSKRLADVVAVIRCGLIHIADDVIHADTETALLRWCAQQQPAIDTATAREVS